MALNTELVEMLVCPVCHARLTLLPAEDGLVCQACAVVYPIEDEIPVMLVDQAVPLAEWTGSR